MSAAARGPVTTTSPWTPRTRLDTNYGFANALLGNFTSYTETDGFADVKGNRPTVEFYGQDTWKVSRTLTVDYGMRFLWFRPWASTKEGTRSASWDPDRYIPGGSPLLYTPVRVNNQNFAQNPVTGELRPAGVRRIVRAEHG